MSRSDNQPFHLLVTGSASGIGAALVKRLIGPRLRVLIHAKGNKEGAERLAAAVEDAQGEAIIALGDLSEPDTSARLIHTMVKRFGALDAVVANAGWADRTPLLDTTPDQISRAHAGIAASFAALSKHSVPYLRQSSANGTGSRIVAVSAFGPHVYRPGVMTFPATAAAKAALETHVRSLAHELARDGITVNAVAPGFIEKDAGTSSSITEDARRAITDAIPMARLGTAEEVAALIAFLLSPEAAYITGQTLHVDGGLT